MRIEAGTPESQKYHLVWHVPLCKALNNVRWVDDETQQYCTYRHGYGRSEYTTHQAKKIEIRPREGTIFIDPIEGVDEETLVTELDSLLQEDLLGEIERVVKELEKLV